jgi:hypothetical protein
MTNPLVRRARQAVALALAAGALLAAGATRAADPAADVAALLKAADRWRTGAADLQVETR